MKIVAIFLAFTVFFAACSKQNATPTAPVYDMVDSSKSDLLFSGSFISGPYGSVSGTVEVYVKQGTYTLAVSDFQTSNGPDLHIYLSKEEEPVHFIDLGKLKSTNGDQVYPIPQGTSFTEYKYALIHCQQYNHLFGSSELKEQ